jgi:hypothetical protein
MLDGGPLGDLQRPLCSIPDELNAHENRVSSKSLTVNADAMRASTSFEVLTPNAYRKTQRLLLDLPPQRQAEALIRRRTAEINRGECLV